MLNLPGASHRAGVVGQVKAQLLQGGLKHRKFDGRSHLLITEEVRVQVIRAGIDGIEHRRITGIAEGGIEIDDSVSEMLASDPRIHLFSVDFAQR